MGWRTNIVLTVLVGGLGSYLYFNEEQKDDVPNDAQLGSEPLLPRGAWRARKIWFQYAENRQPVILELDAANQKFMIVDPVRDVASFAVLESILNVYNTALLVEGYTAEDLAADPALVEKTGLDKPLGKIEFRYAPDDKVVVEFGHPGVREGVMWVRVGDAIYRADPVLRSLLDKNPDEFREHLLFTDFSIGQFRQIRFNRRVEGKIKSHMVERRSLDSIQILEPINARADPAAFGQYLRSIGSLYVKSFITGGTQTNPTDEATDFQITVAGDRGSETLDVRILPSGAYFGHLRRRDINFIVKQRTLVDLARWLPPLRQKKVVSIPERFIQSFELDPGKGEKAVFTRSSQGFSIAAPIEIKKTNATPLGEFLHALTNLTAKGFVDDPGVETGLKDGEGYFTVRVGVPPGTGLKPLAIRIGKDAGKGLIYAKREDEKNVLLLGADDVKPLRRPWLEFASLYAPPLTSNAFRVEVHAPNQKDPIVYTFEEFEWRKTGVDTADDEVRDFVDALKILRSGGIVLVGDLEAKAEAVRVVLRRNTHAASGEIYELSMRLHEKQVVMLVKGFDDIAYLVTQPSFRALYDRWTKR